MRVLWITNFILPIMKQQVFDTQRFSGGWIVVLAEDIVNCDDIELGIAMPAPVTNVQIISEGKFRYYLIPHRKHNRHDVYPNDCREIVRHFKPDIIHAHGTEFPRIKTFLDVWDGKAVVSLQGLRTGIKPYSTGGINLAEMVLSGKPAQMLPAVIMAIQKQLYYRRKWLDLEADIITRAQAVIGRTKWDKAHVHNINPHVNYFTCNESLRSSFYVTTRDPSTIQRYSLIKVTAQAPLKGLHHILRALALLKSQYPDVVLKVVDLPPVPCRKMDLKMRYGYPMLIRQLIKSLELQQHITFLGQLTEKQMAHHMSISHAFVLSSSIENSPNTLGEAMMVGLPCVASYVGGVPDMATDNTEVLLYRYDDPIMLAHQISRIFESDNLAHMLTQAARKRALQTHDREANTTRMLQIYKEL